MKESVHEMYVRGTLYYDYGEFEKARMCFEGVCEQEPDLAEVHSKLGMIYHANGNFQKAAAAFRKALALNPNYTEAALNLVITLNESGRFDEAEEVFRRAADVVRTAPLSIDPFVKGKLAGMHVKTGDAYNEIGWFDEALQEYYLALKMRPDSIEILTKIGLAHRDKGELDRAIDYFQQAKSINSSYVSVLLHLGLTYYRQGRKDLAVREWKAARRIDPECKESATFLRLVEEKGPGLDEGSSLNP